MTLTEFLLARVEEDEAAAREPRWLALEYGVDSAGRNAFSARVLAECDAKRRIVNMEESYEDAYVTAMRALAAVYADHPDYDEGWRR